MKKVKKEVNRVDFLLAMVAVFASCLSLVLTFRIFELKKALKENSGVFLCAEESEEEQRIILNEPLEGARVEPCYGCMESYSPFCFTDEEEELIARVMMAEAGGEGRDGKELVLHVILNRVLDPTFPDTVEGVVYQDLAFSCIGDGRIYEVSPDADCYELISDVQMVYFDASGGATYFCTEGESEWHDNALEFLYSYGGHRFYCEKGKKMEGVI